MKCPKCSFDNPLGLGRCVQCSADLGTLKPGRPTISMDGTVTPADPIKPSQVIPQFKPINITKRVRAESIKHKLKKNPTAQAVLVVGVLLFSGLAFTFLRGDTKTKAVEGNESATTVLDANLPVSTPGSNTVSNVDILASVVQVISECENGETYGGSGTVFIDSNHVLTSNHVVSSDGDCAVKRIFVETIERLDLAPIRTHSATILAIDEAADLAILKIVPIATSSKKLIAIKSAIGSSIGDPITAIGFPAIGGNSVTVTRGEISGFSNFNGIQWIKSSVSISGGNSGGGVFDAAGALVGVPTMVGTAGVQETTDCRADRDTNGDGKVDANDQCVPVGGFINSLSPVKRAVDLAITNGLKP